MPPIALTIAGSDPSGGAGIQADLKTFHQFQVFGTSAITLITAQNTQTVSRVEFLPPDLILDQIRAVLGDLPPGAAKTGALGTAGAVRAVASVALQCPLVVDPVMVSKHGARLLDEDAIDAMRNELAPRAALLAPNVEEAELLTGLRIQNRRGMIAAAEMLGRAGVRAVLVKGGHLEGDALDLLWNQGEIHEFTGTRIHSRHTHGTGCTLSAAITAGLAQGRELYEAVARGKQFITQAIMTAPGLGAGSGPVNHWAIIGNSRHDQGAEKLSPAV